MFVAYFDLHAQYPILSPFALSIGAAPSFIGFIMGMYSITHLPGNMLAGYSVDRYGSRLFIILSLIAAGIILLLQANATTPWQLLVLRSISGFVLAFLSPACLSLLARIARDPVHQGKLMAGNGLVHTLASVISPAAGAFLVAKIGFSLSFTVLGWGLIATGIVAYAFIRDAATIPLTAKPKPDRRSAPDRDSAPTTIPWLFFAVPLAVSCSQGVLFFELPLMNRSEEGIFETGIMFSLISFGALITLGMLFLNALSPFFRVAFGSLALALVFFGISIEWPVPLYVSLLLIGLAKGVIFPATASLLIALSGGERYGRMFSILSIAYSIGAFIGPLFAGQLRAYISPYFIAFLVLMLALTLLPGYWKRATMYTHSRPV